ncbi:clostridial binary toxin A, partial [Streptococcus sp. oral taxon 058 str. F0407]
QDLVAFKELLAATKALIAEHAGKTRTVGSYQSGDFAKLQSVQRFAIAYQQATKQMESRVERVKAAQERDKARFEALAAEDRAKKGWIDLGLGVLTAAIGVLAIVATCGSATPLVFGFGLTAGLGTFAYGTSNAGEGIHNIQLGNAGDGHTKAKNFIRDTLFMGNDKLYHQVGGIFVTASSIMIPIGHTQSVVKGLTQFAIGEAGAYTTGQVAYHGTKLLGGSEEDAQTANFIGNIVGGYAASSAASKFSLNKVKVDVETPKYSTQELDTYFRKSQQSFTNAEAEGLRVYTSNDYTYINNYLRGFSDDLGPISTSTISDIDSALSKMELPADLTLYRGTSSAPFMNIVDKNYNGTLDWNSLVGKTFEDRAFVSTSVESKTAFGGGVRWEINAPKGSKGGMVNTFSMFPNENELLLPRNSKFLIKGIDKVDNNIILKMDLIE